MLHVVAHITLEEVVDSYLRARTHKIGQAEMARIIGTQRQGVNAIINNREGRRFTLEHLSRYAEKTGIPTSRLLRDLAVMAWEQEGEMLPRPTLPAIGQPSEPEPAQGASLETVADLLRELVQEIKRRP